MCVLFLTQCVCVCMCNLAWTRRHLSLVPLKVDVRVWSLSRTNPEAAPKRGLVIGREGECLFCYWESDGAGERQHKLLAKWYSACGRWVSRFFLFGVGSADVPDPRKTGEGGCRGGLISGDVEVTWVVTNGTGWEDGGMGDISSA